MIGSRQKYPPEVDILAVADAPLHASAPVGFRAEASIGFAHEGVVVFAPGDLGAFEARADLKGLGSGDAEHSVRQRRFEAVEHGLAQPGRNVAQYAGDGAADGVEGGFSADYTLRESR